MSTKGYTRGDCRTVEPDTDPTYQRGNRRPCSLHIFYKISLLLACFWLARTITNSIYYAVLVPMLSAAPWPDATFIIRDRATGKAITRKDNQIILARVNGMGGQQWHYLEAYGWAGFRNPDSGKYLGTNVYGELIASADHHNSWEQFDIRKHPDGGYVLSIRHFQSLWYIGKGKGMELVQVPDRAKGIQWDFIEV